MNLSGKALEIGGRSMAKCAMNFFPSERFEYFDLSFGESDIPNTIVGDITDAHGVDDESFDLVFSSDVFEHIDRPWLAASEICRILKPGGISITATLWSWRNHPCPIDYWRFSPDCLEFLFSGLETVEKDFDLSQRRHDKIGSWASFNDAVPLDSLGGFRENWAVYHVGVKKPLGRSLPLPFKETSHELAIHLKQDVRGDAKRVINQRKRYAKGKLFYSWLRRTRFKRLVPLHLRRRLNEFVREKVR